LIISLFVAVHVAAVGHGAYGKERRERERERGGAICLILMFLSVDRISTPKAAATGPGQVDKNKAY
jgi:hypothetical protein